MYFRAKRRIADDYAVAIWRDPFEIPNDAILDNQRCALQKADTVEAGRGRRAAVYIQATKNYVYASPVDDDAVGAGRQRRTFDVLARNRHRFGDGDGTKAAGIDAIDDAACRGF